VQTLPHLTSGGFELDTSPASFGFLRNSGDLIGNVDAQRARMHEDGYLFLSSFLERELVLEVRRAICQVLNADGVLDPNFPIEAAIAKEGLECDFRPDIANQSSASAMLRDLIYGPKMMAFFSDFLEAPAMHYEYTWLRVIAPGKGTYPHCDIVYMGRGTQQLYTAWVPLGDVPLQVGGLILIEGSHQNEELRKTYCKLDVDTACENRGAQSQLNAAGFPGFGALSFNVHDVRSEIGGRILTAPEYRMGDVLIFTAFTVHGSLDNHSREIRISSDSRYQPANEPADERWIGENPPGHGGESVRKLIC